MANFLFVSRYSIANADLTVIDSNGDVVDADLNAVTASMHEYGDGTELFSRSASRVETGVYRVTLSSVETSDPGLYYLKFVYQLDSVNQEYQTDVEIPVTSSPLYEALSVGMRDIIEGVWMRFSDLFDSAIGGPHLKEYAQSNFGRERIAELLRVAVGRLNTISQPYQGYEISGDNEFPIAQWGPLLEQATMVEAIKHLIRSYVEQPNAEGIPAARLDRRDYMNRWGSVLSVEESTLASQLDIFKMASMNLGQPSIMVAGGVYGNLVRNAPPARPRHRPPIAY